jgi:serine/threonine protein kinase
MNQNLSSDIRSLPIGYVLSDYRIEGTLGHGAFGITYLATDTMLNRKVAIKEYFPREFAHRDGTLLVKPAGNKEDRDNFSWGLTRFLEEARVLALFDHPNIVPVRRFFEANGTAYLVMDYCDGIPLDSLISREGSLTKDQVLKILYPILDGLERVHKANFLHRDIKPANIFIKADGSPVLLDFGAARQEMLSHSRSVTSMATPGYAAFEQYSTHGKQGPWTDIYGLGATLYRAITGEKPQDAPDRILEDKLIPCFSLAAGKYEEKFLLAIDAAIAIRPENRPQSIAEWRRIFGLQQTVSLTSESLSTQRETEVIHTLKQISKDNRAELPTQKKKFTTAIGIGLAVLSLSLVTYFAMNDAGEQNKVASVVTPTPTPLPLPPANDTKSTPIKDIKPPPVVQEEKKIVTLPPCVGEPNLKTWKNCRGTYIASSGKHAGDKYTGDFDENGNFTGNGTYTFANGDVYSGALKEGVRTGKGTLTRANGTKYIGDWKNDFANGAGTLIFPSGDKYVGGFKDGKFNGRGTYSFTNGDKYVGNHENDVSSGFGVYTHADGRRFEGNYVNGERNGFGTSYDAKGIKIYSGQWENNRVKADSSTPSTAPTSSLAKCNAYAAQAKKSLGLPKKIDDITTATDIFCLNTSGKPTFVYKYDVESELRFDQAVLESSVRANNRKLVCAPDIRMYLPIVDIEYQYYFSTSPSSFAPGKLIGKLSYSDSDCK